MRTTFHLVYGEQGIATWCDCCLSFGLDPESGELTQFAIELVDLFIIDIPMFFKRHKWMKVRGQVTTYKKSMSLVNNEWDLHMQFFFVQLFTML